MSLNIKYFGSSIPIDKISSKIKRRDLIIQNATKKREAYILNSLLEIPEIKKLDFISTAYGKRRGFYKTEKINSKKVHYNFLGYFGNKFFRILSSYFFSILWVFRNVRKRDTIIIYNFPPVYAIPILLIKIFLQIRLIIEFEDFYNVEDKRSLIYKPFENLGIKYADSFIASSIGMRDFILKKRKTAKIIINGGYFDDIEIKEQDPNDFKNLFKLVYTGTLVENRGIMNLINSFQELKSDDFELIITGSGRLEKLVSESIKKDARIRFLGLVDDEKLNQILEEADICINPQIGSISVNFPSKISLYLSYGKVVLSTKNSSLLNSPYKNLLYYYDEFNPNSFSDEVFKIKNNWAAIERTKIEQLAKFKEIFQKQERKLIKLLIE